MASPTDDRSFTYRIDRDNRLTFVSDQWLEFARENDAPELTREEVLGQPIERYIADWETAHLYELIYRRVRETGTTVELPFRCDTPRRRRFMRLTLRLLANGEIEHAGQIMAVEKRPPVPLLDPEAPRSRDQVTICSWCKRVKTDRDRYLEIEQALPLQRLFGDRIPLLTHGTCPECFDRIRRELEI